MKRGVAQESSIWPGTFLWEVRFEPQGIFLWSVRLGIFFVVHLAGYLFVVYLARYLFVVLETRYIVCGLNRLGILRFIWLGIFCGPFGQVN